MDFFLNISLSWKNRDWNHFLRELEDRIKWIRCLCFSLKISLLSAYVGIYCWLPIFCYSKCLCIWYCMLCSLLGPFLIYLFILYVNCIKHTLVPNVLLLYYLMFQCKVILWPVAELKQYMYNLFPCVLDIWGTIFKFFFFFIFTRGGKEVRVVHRI